jgi:hypothetical protein
VNELQTGEDAMPIRTLDQGVRRTRYIRRFLVAALTAAMPLAAGRASAQAPTKTRNVVVIMSDGLRWQDVFHGADPALIDRKSGGVSDTAELRREFARGTREEARRALLPFVWTTVAREGQIFGNREKGSDAHVTNGFKFSYPGYNETLSGHADPRIDSNGPTPNPNVTVFEWLGRQPDFRGKVAAFGTWNRFAEIFNRDRAGFPVFSGWDPPFPGTTAPAEAQLNELYRTTTRLFHDVAYDSFMQQAVLDYLGKHQPRVLFVGYGETDEWAHARRYDQYLESARRADAFIAQLWKTMQAMPQYRGTTTFIITTDHGRGGGPADWTDHGKDVEGAENIWMAVLGPDTRPLGERANTGAVTQSQVAATVAALLGKDFRAAVPAAAPPIEGVVR